MRVLKFRAWDEDSQKMNGNVEIYINKDKTIEVRSKDDKTIVMQFTGLKDENGKEVFEGDIIKDSEDFIAQVVYDKEYAGFGLNYQPFDLTEGLSVTFEELKNEYQNTFEIIGNIYENPELLEGE
ncbi:YopX family protein [Streptococcus sp.]|uniref:YopX family protein n=1 Tax=Streptococcus sp. TaxID=1306 RepID=UPI003AF08740